MSRRVAEPVDIEALSSNNIQRHEFRRQFSDSRKPKVMKAKFKLPKRNITNTAVELPHIGLNEILIYASKQETFHQKHLEDYFLTDTKFKNVVEHLGIKSKKYNFRMYSRAISDQITELIERGLLKIESSNNCGNKKKNLQNIISIKLKGLEFFEYLHKHHALSLYSSGLFDLDKNLRRYYAHKNTRALLGLILLGIFVLFIIYCVGSLIVTYGSQLEGILWTRKNSTANTSILLRLFAIIEK